jgi:hypothetical protein
MPFAMPSTIQPAVPLSKWALGYEMSNDAGSSLGTMAVGKTDGLELLLQAFLQEHRSMPFSHLLSMFWGPQSPTFKRVRLNVDPLQVLISVRTESQVLDFINRFGIPSPHRFFVSTVRVFGIGSEDFAVALSIPAISFAEVLELARFIETTLDLKFHPSKTTAGEGSRQVSMRNIRAFGNRHLLRQDPHLSELKDAATVDLWLREATTLMEDRINRICPIRGVMESSPPKLEPQNLEGIVLMQVRQSLLGHGKTRRRCLECDAYFEVSHEATKFCPDNGSCKNAYNKRRYRERRRFHEP